jgi:hypothetical protein
VILVGLLPCPEHESSTKELFTKDSNGLRGLSQNMTIVSLVKWPNHL